MNKELEELVAAALRELIDEHPNPNSPWWHVQRLLAKETPEYRGWWWRSIQKQDTPTWRALRLKVTTLRLKR